MNVAKSIMGFCLESGRKYECRWDYSGRMMFGRECVGIVCDNVPQMMASLAGYLSGNGEDLPVGGMCQDNMGKGFIVYFPNIVWEYDDIAGMVEKFCNQSDGRYVFHKEYEPSGKEGSFVGVACDGMVDLLGSLAEYMEENRVYDVKCELAGAMSEESELGYIVYFPYIKKKG